ncbi:SRPBCC family protein [Micromonospora sp. WMMD558]|uniref:SRPBCC family protein n=1 Tax=unclassified Micromonospora TaxID=2617518 RepID=UPI0012B4CE97|nr:carbon monoxide dehydrogenase subunit G [Micromonospora sp. WMMC415]QGN48030.1 carbon monoxide dehydrogenase [Micromonospora sp. WMMC415]
MKVSGTAFLHGPVETVYAVLNDPAVLVRTIPGCETLEQVGPDAYQATVTAGVASIKGSFAGEVRLTDQNAPHSFVLHASGAGAPGTVSADVTVTLADEGDGVTLLSYDAEAVVGGMIGGVGQRILAGVAKKTAAEFFAAVDAVLTGAAPAEEAPAPVSAEAPAGLPVEATAAPTLFSRPHAVSAPAGGLLPGGDFTLGVAVGAGIALLGALVGGLVAGRAARRR